MSPKTMRIANESNPLPTEVSVEWCNRFIGCGLVFRQSIPQDGIVFVTEKDNRANAAPHVLCAFSDRGGVGEQ